MSVPADATEMADLITRLGLANEFTVKDLLFELDDKKGPAEPLIRLMERKRLLTPFQGTKLLKGDTDGYFMGGYRILYKIASGTFGRVYRGDHPRTGQVVAIKVLRRKWSESPQKIAQFEREGRLGLTLQHPNIVQILAVGKDSSTDSHYIVMEFVEGGNLRDILTIRKKIDLAGAMRIMSECVAGLVHANSRGMTHRDIKASNILIGTDGVSKLVDFGLAEVNAALVGSSNLPQKGKGKSKQEEEVIDRTLDYSGLEKNTNVKQGDVRSDIYFLGHVLFEMITGEPLMVRSRERRIALEKRRFEEVESTLDKLSQQHGIPPQVRRVIAKAVAFNPMQRYQTPEQFYEAIENVRQELDLYEQPSRPEPGSNGAAATTSGEEEVPESTATRPPGTLTIVVVERNTKLHDAFRDRLTRLGFRVLLTSEISQAVERYEVKPFHALLVDTGAVGAEGATGFGDVLNSAAEKNQQIAGVLILNPDDAALAVDYIDDPRAGVLIRPITMKQVTSKLQELVPELSAQTAEEAE